MAPTPRLTRSEAKALGCKYYYTGTPCVNGHFATRLVKSYKCARCVSDTQGHSYDKNHEKIRKRQKVSMSPEDRAEARRRSWRKGQARVKWANVQAERIVKDVREVTKSNWDFDVAIQAKILGLIDIKDHSSMCNRMDTFALIRVLEELNPPKIRRIRICQLCQRGTKYPFARLGAFLTHRCKRTVIQEKKVAELMKAQGQV